MRIQLLDILVIILYLVVVASIGVIMKKRAQRSKNDYMLGGNTLPWWMLGISNASGMFDISGTIWMVSIMFIYGLKSIWLVWLWPVFNQVFLFVYLAGWLRRSGASTGAEWMLTRFGNKKDAQLAHKIIIAFALLSCFGFMAYGFIGLGKFIEIFIPFSSIAPYVPFSVSAEFVPHFYGIIFTLFAMFYSVVGGMSSIVWADLVQYALMALGSVSIGIIAMGELSGQTLQVPPGWSDIFFGWNLDLDWSDIIADVNQKIIDDKYSPFGMFFSLMLAKGVLASIAGPAPNYDMQKILSTKSPREAALMSMFVNVVLLPTRYFMIIGFTVLGLLYYNDLNIQTAAGRVDFERILPAAILKFAPVGLLGLFLVELMAAFMGTFAGTLNAAQAYIVNDIYLKSIKPKANNRQISRANYLVGVVVVIISIVLGIFAKDVNSVLQWIVGALYGGYVAANVLKWHWWRFNGAGFFWGMAAGIVSAMVLPYVFSDTLLTPPTETEVLKKFYRNVRPWGFWGPIHAEILKEDPLFERNKNFSLDMFNVVIGTVAQTSITSLPVFVVLLMPVHVTVTAVVLTACVLILWRTWYRKLPDT